jgi:hypothetical protein
MLSYENVSEPMTPASNFRKLSMGCALAVLAFFIVDFIGVVFFGGINVKLGPAHFRSTTLEFPIIGLLVSFLIYLLISGGTKECLLFACSLVFALGLAEIGVRFLDHPLSRPVVNFNHWYEPSELYGHQLVKSFEGLGPLQVPVQINFDGFRDGEHPLIKDDGAIRILGLGDSFTFGWGVPEEKTYLNRLEQDLRQVTGRKAETIKTGVPGWGLNQYYLCLKEFGLKFVPDIVVVGYYIDDLTGPPADKLESVPTSTWENTGHVKMRGGLFQHVRLFNLFTHIADNIKYRNRSKRIPYLNDLQARRVKLTENVNYLIADPGQETTAHLSNLLKEHLVRINSLVTKIGAALIIVVIPDYAQLFHPELQHINRLMSTISRDLNISFLDMTPTYEATEASSPNYFWPLDAHTSEVGHHAIATALLPIICDHLKQRRIPCRPSS